MRSAPAVDVGLGIADGYRGAGGAAGAVHTHEFGMRNRGEPIRILGAEIVLAGKGESAGCPQGSAGCRRTLRLRQGAWRRKARGWLAEWSFSGAPTERFPAWLCPMFRLCQSNPSSYPYLVEKRLTRYSQNYSLIQRNSRRAATPPVKNFGKGREKGWGRGGEPFLAGRFSSSPMQTIMPLATQGRAAARGSPQSSCRRAGR